MSVIESDESPYLVTNYSFDRKDFLIKMYVRGNILKLSIIDNTTSEKWVCTYNSMYIEELTRRTGNYKKFSIFVTMLNSGILRTNNCVRIELLNHKDLLALSERQKQVRCSPSVEEDTRKYLILIYTVEFDKIHYPLPLQYCGMPNPRILQKRINYLEKEKRRLEEELAQTSCNKCATQLPALQNKILKLVQDKKCLEDEVKCLAAELGSRFNIASFPQPQNISLVKCREERLHLQEKIKSLQSENLELTKTVNILNKKLDQTTNTSSWITEQPRRCLKCKTSKKEVCLSNSTNMPTTLQPTLTPIPSTSLKYTSSKSSVSSGKQSIKGRKCARKKKLKKSDNEISSSSCCESNSGINNPQRKTRKNNSIRNSQLKTSNVARISKSDSKFILQRTNSDSGSKTRSNNAINTTKQKNNCTGTLTPEELSLQINALVQVVESWSKNLCSCYSQKQ
ncbi:uncharacterized protein [Rhodnius prolixus]|uniref:Coiled-coil domain-containing protein 61 n=1 Tax=Rhodnius prolixus TaxID=13249 RepID=T1I186_RHOPR